MMKASVGNVVVTNYPVVTATECGQVRLPNRDPTDSTTDYPKQSRLSLEPNRLAFHANFGPQPLW